MQSKVKNIVIVGGGACGWWCAGYLAHQHPNLSITLIESDRIPTIGVGESMLPQIKEFFDEMQIQESSWMEKCDAIYKLGNRFENWYKKGDASIMTFWWNFDERLIKASLYHRPGNHIFFGEKKCARLGDYWCYLYQQGEKSLDDFYYDMSDAAGLADSRCAPKDWAGHNYLSSWAGYAYHIDADKSAHVVRDNVALPKGVQRKIGTIASVVTGEKGIEYLIQDDNTKIYADLFLDCTGFARALMKHMDCTFVYYDKILCNSVCVAPIRYNNYCEDIVPYTISTARDFGWQFTIPLTTRMGSGYVYSDHFVSEEEIVRSFREYWKAYTLLAEPRILKWTPSRLKHSWQKNVCAIGLSNGLIEPLEANVLYNAQYAIQTLSKLLAKKDYYISPASTTIFNKVTMRTMDHTADYIFHRYASTSRTDTAFWAKYKQMGEESDVLETLWENYMHNTNPLVYLYPDSIWLSTAAYMNAIKKEFPIRINPNLLDNARAIFEYNARISKNGGKILPKIWEMCPQKSIG